MNIITQIKIDDVLNNKDEYNVSNLLPSEDYKRVLKFTNTCNWITQFHDDNVLRVTDKNVLKWIKEAVKLYTITGKMSNLYSDELESFEKTYENFNEILKDGKFIRTDHVSLKTGIHGIGPYHNIKQIIESICTSSQHHAAIEKDDKVLNIYIVPWIVMDQEKEFRLFVHNDKLTGVSQQNIYKVNKWLNDKNTDTNALINKIKKYYYEDFIVKWLKTKSSKLTKNFTMDIVILENNEVHFIEANPFGPEYAAGSSLFHWLKSGALYNDDDIIEFRYTILSEN